VYLVYNLLNVCVFIAVMSTRPKSNHETKTKTRSTRPRPGQDYKTKIKTKTGAVLYHSPASICMSY